MKFRVYTVDSFKDHKYFCPSCHRRLENNSIMGGNIKALNGFNVNCGNCKNGKIKIQPSQKLKDIWKEEEEKNKKE